jgi:hypothetical protein
MIRPHCNFVPASPTQQIDYLFSCRPLGQGLTSISNREHLPREAAARTFTAQARIGRAQDNIKEFAQLLGKYLEGRPSRIRVDIDAQGHGSIRVERREPIPDQLSILLGEALQNLRAGFDNCLYAVAIIDSGTKPPPGASRLQWPIALSPKEWTGSKKRLQHLSPHLIEALHRIQPFQAENPGWNCLRILHDLARIDRHRAAHELAMRPEKVKGNLRQEDHSRPQD